MASCSHTFATFLSLLLALVFQSTSGQFPVPGPCKTVDKVENFNFDEYIGRWYEYAGTLRTSDFGHYCIEFRYKEAEGDRWPISRLYVSPFDGREYNFTKDVKINKQTGEGVTTDGYPFTVVGTDYLNYAVVYACSSSGPLREEITWILTRKRQPDRDTISKSNEVLMQNNLYSPYLYPIRQTHCPDNWDEAINV